MHYLDIASIQRSPWWPVRHRPRPTEAEIARAAETYLITPVIVRRAQDAGSVTPVYEIVDNELSWAIAQAASIHQVPVIVMDISQREAKDFVLARYRAAYPNEEAIETLEPSSRLGPMALAYRYQEALQRVEASPRVRLRRRGRRCTISLVARECHTSPALVRQHLNLLKLLPEIQQAVASGNIPFGAARRMHPLSDARQRELARLITVSGYSVRDVEHWLRERRRTGTPAEIVKPGDPDLKRFERLLAERIGSRVELKPGKSGAGRLVIHYHSADHLAGIMERPLALGDLGD